MYFRKSIISAILLLVLGLTTLFSQQLNIYKNSGTHNIYRLENLRKLTFTTDKMYVFQKGYSPMTYFYQDIRCMTFSDLNTATLNYNVTKSGDIFWYPNPVNDEMNILFQSMDCRKVQITIYTVEGKMLFKEVFNARRGKNFKKVYLSNLMNGVFICRMNTGLDIKTFKILKH